MRHAFFFSATLICVIAWTSAAQAQTDSRKSIPSFAPEPATKALQEFDRALRNPEPNDLPASAAPFREADALTDNVSPVVRLDVHQELSRLAAEASALMTDEEREVAKDELLAKIAALKAKRALEAAKKQLENIIKQQPDSEAAATAKRMLTAMEAPTQPQLSDEQAAELAPTLADPVRADANAIPQLDE